MSFYFKYIPKVDYNFKVYKGENPSFATGQEHANEHGVSGSIDRYTGVQDITRRFALKQVVAERQALFYSYLVEENETAQEIAARYYDDAKLDWIIYMTNNIHDPYYEWPMDSYTFELYIRKKYGSLAQAQSTMHSWWHILTHQQTLDTGAVISERRIQVDQHTYNSLAANVRDSYTNYDWEVSENNNKRTIEMLDADFVPDILRRVKKLYR